MDSRSERRFMHIFQQDHNNIQCRHLNQFDYGRIEEEVLKTGETVKIGERKVQTVMQHQEKYRINDQGLLEHREHNNVWRKVVKHNQLFHLIAEKHVRARYHETRPATITRQLQADNWNISQIYVRDLIRVCSVCGSRVHQNGQTSLERFYADYPDYEESNDGDEYEHEEDSDEDEGGNVTNLQAWHPDVEEDDDPPADVARTVVAPTVIVAPPVVVAPPVIVVPPVIVAPPVVVAPTVVVAPPVAVAPPVVVTPPVVAPGNEPNEELTQLSVDFLNMQTQPLLASKRKVRSHVAGPPVVREQPKRQVKGRY